MAAIKLKDGKEVMLNSKETKPGHEALRLTNRPSPKMFAHDNAAVPKILYQSAICSTKYAVGPPGSSLCSIHIIWPITPFTKYATALRNSMIAP